MDSMDAIPLANYLRQQHWTNRTIIWTIVGRSWTRQTQYRTIWTIWTMLPEQSI
jgi:hypothetical protein